MTALHIRPLNDRETALLSECEETIAAGIMTFAEVGEALLVVRDQKLFRRDFPNFEDYCVARWQISRQRAYQLMAAAEIVSTVVDKGLPAPANEAQARALGAVPEDDLATVWKTVVDEHEKPTVAAIRAAAEEHRGLRPGDGTDARVGASVPGPEVAASGEESSSAVSSDDPRPVPPVGRGSTHDDELVDSPVGPMTKDFADVLNEHVPDENPHREWRRKFFDAIVAARKVMRAEVEDVVAKADAEAIDELHRVARDLSSYSDRIAASIASKHSNVMPLRRVK